MTIDATPATLVEVSLTLVASFDAASFDEAKRSDLAQSLRVELGCYEPECVIVLRVPAGSLRVTAVLTIPDSAAAADATAAAVKTSAIALVAKPASAITASLGVAVTSAAPISISRAVVPIVTAPPPPPLPPPSPTSLPPPPALPPLPPPQGRGGGETPQIRGEVVAFVALVAAIASIASVGLLAWGGMVRCSRLKACSRVSDSGTPVSPQTSVEAIPHPAALPLRRSRAPAALPLPSALTRMGSSNYSNLSDNECGSDTSKTRLPPNNHAPKSRSTSCLPIQHAWIDTASVPP